MPPSIRRPSPNTPMHAQRISTPNTLQSCPQCGAALPGSEGCHSRFEGCLALEYENPATYGRVHLLTVACYMLQHNAYSRPAWLQARHLVAQSICQGTSPAELRRRMAASLGKPHRTWRLTTGEKLAEFDRIAWSRSIANVRLNNAQEYCADVESWASSVLADTDFLLEKDRYSSPDLYPQR